VKKNRGDEPIGVKLHIYREMSKGNSLCKQEKKCHFFSSFSYTKSENRRVEQVLPGGDWYQWQEGGGRERV
jgi:hypothetical protein